MSQSAVSSGPQADKTRHIGAKGRQVERAIRMLISEQERLFPEVLLTTDMLCEAVFGGEGPYTKAQHALVLRVIHRIVATEPGWSISRHQHWLQFSKCLAQARKRTRDVLSGNPTNLLEAQRVGQAANREAAESSAANILPVVQQIQASGVTALRAIAQALNERGVRTARGSLWYGSTVRNLLARAGT